jgi:uncharacterized MAPEG superfamily protein
MTVAYWCVFIAALLPYVWSMSWRWPVYSFEANLAPRALEAALSGWRQRAHWAHLNAFENFPPFVASVIIAQQLGAPQARVDALALTFVAMRLAHGACYLANLGVPRSLAFAGGGACSIAIFLSAV